MLVLQALVLGVVVHLVWCRSWPPYVVKNMPLGTPRRIEEVVLVRIRGVIYVAFSNIIL